MSNNTIEYNVSSKIEKGVTVITFTRKKDVMGIIEIKGRYTARIGYNGSKHLGIFETREEAVERRLLAEKHVKEGTFDDWYKSIRKRGNSH